MGDYLSSRDDALLLASGRVDCIRNNTTLGDWRTTLGCCHRVVEYTLKAAVLESASSTGFNHALHDLAFQAGIVSKDSPEFKELREFSKQHGDSGYALKRHGVDVNSEAYVRPWMERAYAWVARIHETRGWPMPYSRKDFGLS